MKFADILKEAEAVSSLNPQEKAAYDDLISSLEEASGKSFIEKLTKIAKDGLLKGLFLTTLLGSPELTDAQKTQVQNLAKDTTTQSVTKAPKWEAKSYISTQMMDEWNKYVDWLKKTKVEDLAPYIETDYKGGGILAGNLIMNHEDYSDVVLDVYNEIMNPKIKLTKADIIPIQAQMRDYRNWAINTHIDDGGMANKNNKIKFNFTPNADYSNFMSNSLNSKEDGITGIYTSRIFFPRTYITTIVNGKKISTTDVGYTGKTLNYGQNK